MGRTVRELDAGERAGYRRALGEMLRRRGQEEEKLRSRAWEVARRAAGMLRGEFGVRRVRLFGSLARGVFGPRSDVDLAVEGLPEELFLRAVVRLLDLDPEIPVDLVPLEAADPPLRRAVEEEGIEL